MSRATNVLFFIAFLLVLTEMAFLINLFDFCPMPEASSFVEEDK